MKLSIQAFLIITVVLLLNCTVDTKSITYHGLVNAGNLTEIVKIELSKFNTFDQLVDEIEQIVCNDRIPTLSITKGQEEKLLGLANPCWEETVCIHIKRRNVLKIKNGKIQLTTSTVVDSLKEYITKHYNNNGKSYMFSESPRRALISITYDKEDLSSLESVLNNTINYYSTLNLELPLIVSLDRKIPPPPPPTTPSPPHFEFESSK